MEATMDRAELLENFEHFDTDGNGRIDFGEFSDLLDALDSGLADEEKRIGFEAIDENANGWIEFEEFSSWWTDRED